MIIAVCTSTPFSVTNAKATFESICKQTVLPDRIIWNYPKRSIRFDMDYPEIPAWTSEFGDLLHVNVCEDFGPSTKVIPILSMENVSKLLIFDDDVYYDPRCIQTLLEAGQDSTAVGFCGHTYKLLPFKYNCGKSWITATKPSIHNEVAVLLCTRMVLYPRKTFPDTETGFLEHLHAFDMYFKNDDHLYAAMAFRKQISMHVIHLENDRSYDTVSNTGRLTGTNATLQCETKMVCKGEMPISFFLIDLFLILLVFLCFCVLVTTRKKSSKNL
jgi:hypothetical protein